MTTLINYELHLNNRMSLSIRINIDKTECEMQIQAKEDFIEYLTRNLIHLMVQKINRKFHYIP